MTDAKTLIERSKGKLKMVVQRDERATLLNVPDLSDSVHSANASERDGEYSLRSFLLFHEGSYGPGLKDRTVKSHVLHPGAFLS